MIKYAPAKYSYLLTRMGCLRVGTLHDFRIAEHKIGIHDPQEGKKQVFHRTPILRIENTNSPSTQQSKDFQALSAFGAIHLENCANVYIGPQDLRQDFDTSDCFIFCLSGRNSPDLYKEFGGSDTRVRISDIKQFLELITQSLSAIVAVRFKGFQPVTNTSREQQWNGRNWGEHPAMIKEPKFTKQHEYRAIWEPIHAVPIFPVVLGNSKLPLCCEMLGH